MTPLKNATTRFLWFSSIAAIITNLMSLFSLGSQPSASHMESWPAREITEFGLRFKLPEKYKEKHWDVVAGMIQIRSYHAGLAIVDFRIREGTTLESLKTGRQLNFDEYREWTDEIRGHKVLIQSFRGGGTVITDKGAFRPYQVAVVCALDTKQFLGINATCATKEEQEEILAMVGTLEFL